MSPSQFDQIREAARIDKEVFSYILNMSHVDEDGIILSLVDAHLINEQERIFEDQIVGVEMGPIFASYPNVPLKAVYGSLSSISEIQAKIPPYVYSCPAIDDMLLGKFPTTGYFDISRGGPASVLRRSIGYVHLAQQKLMRAEDSLTRSWVARYGIGTVIPVITFDKLVTCALMHDAKMYAVPATSVAESLTACAAYFTGMREDIRRLTHRDDWMQTNGQSRNKGSMRIYEALHRYILTTRGYDFFKQILASGSSLSEIAHLYMELTEKAFLLGSTREQITHTFAEMMYDPQSHRSHPSYGAQADCSELVIRSAQNLAPTPWELIILCGDVYGTTFSQIHTIARYIKKALPDSVIIILADENRNLLIPRDETTLTPSILDYLITGWSSYVLEAKINRQKNHLMSQQSATR